MLHPPIAHFAISLPIISLIIGLAYLYRPSEIMSKISTRFMLFAAIFIIAAFFSGKEDGSEVFPLISSEGQEVLKAHKDLALYLLVGMVLATALKMFGCLKKVYKAEVAAVLLVALVAGGVLYQGKMGGELTFTYGAHVKDHSDGMDCLDDPEFFLDE